jgi:hypothetical protein
MPSAAYRFARLKEEFLAKEPPEEGIEDAVA